MSIFNDKELKHPAFHDEKIEKRTPSDYWFGVFIGALEVLGLVACVLFCIWILMF